MKTIMQPVKPHTMPVRKLDKEILNWAVAQALGMTIYPTKRGEWMTAAYGEFNHRLGIPYWRPTTDWAQGGPIIEREKVEITFSSGQWQAGIHPELHELSEGSTPLIAAMRCIVASVFGKEIPIPKEML